MVFSCNIFCFTLILEDLLTLSAMWQVNKEQILVPEAQCEKVRDVAFPKPLPNLTENLSAPASMNVHSASKKKNRGTIYLPRERYLRVSEY